MANTAKSTSHKPRLGRGLSSLIVNSTLTEAPDDLPQTYVTSAPSPAVQADDGSAAKMIPIGRAVQIPIDQIAPNPMQPRRDFKPEELSDLADSISRQGILQPLLARPAATGDADKPYVLIAGERRLRAAAQAGLKTVPCLLRQADAEQMLAWSLVENIQREDLNPIERASAYRQYVDRFALTQAEAAERLGQPRTTVSNHLRLLELQDVSQDLLASGALSFGHGKVLAALTDDPARQVALAHKAADEALSVRQLEAMIADGHPSPPSRRAAVARPAYLTDMEEKLTQSFGTRVAVRPGRAKHSGKVIVEYYSLDDFDRIARALGAGEEL
jgi:ParB family chromosome partitioning protein